MMSEQQIEIPQEILAEFCRRNHILRLSLFGSVLHDSFGPNSDVDVLVEFDPDHVPGFALIRIQDELSALLGGRNVDLVTPKFLNRRIRKQVESEARVQYAQN
jgi:predicted nucleotidyltransferase